MFGIDPTIHMWFSLIATVFAVYAFVRERIPIEVTCVTLLTALLLFGHLFPLPDAQGVNQLQASAFLDGFANPSLIAVMALLVMGQGMIQTDALRAMSSLFVFSGRKMAWLSVVGILFFVCVFSAFMNNTPLVVIAIPLLQALAHSAGVSQSRVMIPLSYVAILGGMITLIGSSTNLLVSSSMVDLGYQPLSFFSFVVPGAFMAGTGFLYVFLAVPRLLPDRATMLKDFAGSQKEFVAEIDVGAGSSLVGVTCVDGSFPDLGNLNVKLVQRSGHLILPPFENYVIEEGDILIVAASRKTLADLLSKYPGFLLSEEETRLMRDGAEQDADSSTGAEGGGKSNAEARVMAEIMITPASRMVDMSLEHVNFQRQFGTIVLGIQRRAKAVRRRLGRIRLEAGDVLLVAGTRSSVDSMRGNTDVIVLSGSKRDLLVPRKAPVAGLVFFSAIALSAFGVLTIPVAAVTGAVMMLATGCLNIRQATRAIDRKIFLLVGSMLALGALLQISGGALYIADLILNLSFVQTPLVMISMLFILVAVSTNLLTNNACAILFTPIAMSLADKMEAPPGLSVDMTYLFAITVIFAANCSFASPIGYQTNLLIMGPGHYRFRDFIKAGVPLIFLLWGVHVLVLKYYFGL